MRVEGWGFRVLDATMLECPKSRLITLYAATQMLAVIGDELAPSSRHDQRCDLRKMAQHSAG